jgi:uroporphyrinogen decarboxylase
MGRVWFTLFERFWFLRGFNNALTDPYIYPREFLRLIEKITEFNVASINMRLDLGLDGIFFSDDWGSQTNLLMKPDDWRKWYKPQYRRMFDAVHAGGGHVWMHLCGNVMDIIPDLMDIGLDVLNPVQPLAMPVDVLSKRFGGQLCFYGGLDVQGVLPRGTSREVEDEVRHLISALGCWGGGHVGGTSHTILPDTPTENVVAAFGAFREHSGYTA